MGVGEALVSMLGGKGTPGIVERTLIRPPASRLGPATIEERQQVIQQSMLGSRYDQAIDRKSAYETLKERADKAVADDATQAGTAAREKARSGNSRRSNRQGVMEAMIKSVVRSIGSSLGRQISRGILGSILKR
jgi:hypothetical protein